VKSFPWGDVSFVMGAWRLKYLDRGPVVTKRLGSLVET
jgi:hypothetical protein